MVGKAALYNEEDVDYEELKTSLINHFDLSPTKETKLNILFGRKKKIHQNVTTFAQDIRRLTRECECQNLELQLFINGLPNFIKEYVLLSKPETIDEAITAARVKEEISRKNRSSNSKPTAWNWS